MAADDTSDPNRSGSHPEPDAASTPAGSEEPTTALPGTDPKPDPEPEPPAPAADTARPRRRRTIGVPVAAAVATGLVIASGLGGFALGAATSDDHLSRVSDGRGTGDLPPFLDGRDGRGHQFPGAPPGFDGDGGEGDQGSDGSGTDQDSGSTT
jgi:hypothetical protein